MKILIIPSEHFVTDSNPLGGIFQYHQAKALSNAGFQIDVLSVGFITPRYLTTKYFYKRRQKDEEVNIFRLYRQLYFPHRFLPFLFLKRQYINMANKLFLDYVNEFGQPDIIHAHNFLFAGVVAQFLKKKYSVPFMITEHSSSFVRENLSDEKLKTIQDIAKDSFVVTAVSSRFQNILSDCIKSDVFLLPNIVDSSLIRNYFSINAKEIFTFLHVASLDENKNQELLIKSFKKLANISEKIHLRIAGEGNMLLYLKNLVKDLKIDHQVTFLGRISREQLMGEMHRSNCFVLSSNFETFGVVLIEALVCGLPLISTRCGGPEDIVNDTNGLLVSVGDQQQLENAMVYMYENSHKYSKVKLNSDAIEQFGAKSFINKAANFYKMGVHDTK